MDIQSFVTGVLADEDALPAISLLQSIRRTNSEMKSTVVVSGRVTKVVCDELGKEFDNVILSENCFVTDREAFTSQVLMESLSSTLFGSFIYIDCHSWVLENIDHLVQTDGRKFNRLNGNGIILLLTFNNSQKKLQKSVLSLKEILNDCTPYTKLANLEEINSIHAWRSTRIISLLNYKKTQPKSEDQFLPGIEPNQIDLELFNRASRFFPRNMELLSQKMTSTETADVSLDSIAIVGMSLRFPGANNVEEFWSLLAEGRDAITGVPDCRWNEQFCTMEGKGKETQAGFLSHAVDDFDAQLFNMSPLEASFMDPQQRMVLELVWEALEDAGIPATSLKDSDTGVFGGWWREDYREIILEATEFRRSKFLRTYMGNTLGTVTSRVSHVLGLTGPSVSTESGCSTSMVAVDLAVKSLQRNECSTALAFGVNLFIRSFGDNDFPPSVVAPDGRSKAFDARADGFGRAEGCAVLVLKRYGDALDDNDRILGVIRGSAVVQDGMSSSLGTPTVDGEALAMQLALKRARVDPKDVEYVESHGTGTPVGDPLEMAAIAKAYGCGGRKKPLVVGSVKTNIGHTESTSGIAGIVKTLLTLEHEMIPKHVNFQTLNPLVKLDAVPAILPLEAVEWKKRRNGRPRLAGVSSFGITGTNAHVIIQEPPKLKLRKSRGSQEPTLHLLKISASSENALCDLKQNYVNFLGNPQTPEIQDITYSINTGRADLSHRTFVVGNSKDDFIKEISRTSIPTPKSGTPNLCFLFTGQGSQSVGMSRELYNSHPLFKSSMDFCFNYLQKNFALNLREVMWEGNIETLSGTKFSQPGIFCVEYCLLKLWESWGIRPDCVLGHSLGEFAAAVAAEIISVEEGLTLVATRSILIDKLEQGSMLVMKGNNKLVESLLMKLPAKTQDLLDIAAMNTEDQTVVAGTKEAINSLKEICRNNNVKCSLLKATHAFHSKMMEPMLEEYMKIAQKVQHRLPRCTYVSGMEGSVVESLSPEYWIHHTSKWVNFLKASSTVLKEVGCDLFVEVGPQPILSSFILENKTGSAAINCFPSLRKSEDEWMTMLTTLGNLYQRNISVDWQGLHYFQEGSKTSVPFYPFQRKQIPFPIAFVKDFYPQVHPLVGNQISNLSEMRVFQKVLLLEEQPFLKDHVVGPLLLYPGAAFLETCLVAGYAGSQCLEGSFQTPLYPLCVEKFQIETPLSLEDQNHTKLQSSVVEKDSQLIVSVGSQATLEDGTKKWIQHARGIFQPFENLDKDILKSVPEDLSSLKGKLNSEISLGMFYDELAKEGLKFGPAFRTIQRVWQNSDVNDEILVELNSKCEGKDHLLHPVVIDGMIQASIFSKSTGQQKIKLAVPISIEKFVWYKFLTTAECFVHIQNIHLDPGNPNLTQTCLTLFDADGARIAIMLEPTIVETTLTSILGSIEVHKNALPSLYEDVWRSQKAPHTSKLQNIDVRIDDEDLNILHTWNKLTGNDQEFYKLFNSLNVLHLIKCLKELGFDFEKENKPFQLKQVISELNIQKKYSSFVFYILMELVEEGYLKFTDETLSHESNFSFIKRLPTLLEAAEMEKSLMAHRLVQNKPEVQDVATVGRNLSKILRGSVSPLAILFPESRGGDDSIDQIVTSPAESYYKTSQFNMHTRKVALETFRSVMKQVQMLQTKDPTNVCRILEVGAGTGAVTGIALDAILDNRVEYTFTDISPVFFKHGKNTFKDHPEVNVFYNLLNIEEDPMSQGFLPQQYDIIIAGFVIHATKDLRTTLRNLRKLIAPHGTLIILELSKPIRSINIIYGTLDGFSSFTDHELRNFNCELPSSKWEGLLNQSGFGTTRTFSAHNNHSAIIVSKSAQQSPSALVQDSEFHKRDWIFCGTSEDKKEEFSLKLLEIGRSVTFIETDGPPQDFQTTLQKLVNVKADTLEGFVFISEMTCEDLQLESSTKIFLSLCKLVGRIPAKRGNVGLKFILVTGNQWNINLDTNSPALCYPIPTIFDGMLKVFQNENLDVTCKSVDLGRSQDVYVTALINEMFTNDEEFSVAHRESLRYIKRCVPLKQALLKKNLPIPKSKRFHIILPESKAIEDLHFAPATQFHLEEKSIEVRVVAYSLNFRDVLVVLKPSEFFEKVNAMGLDYAGIVVNIGSEVSKFKVGDAVFGMSFLEETLASSLVFQENYAMKLPDNMTFEEGATLPAVAGTVYVCLVETAKLKKEDTVLIHTASGGVGLAAIQMAKHIGCRIVATAGNERKRDYVRKLGVRFVYNSRSTEYLADIRRDVGGVDVVLNSLTSEGFKEATLAACNHGARFVEMSKLNVWSPEEVKALRPDVAYSLVDLSSQTQEEAIELSKSIEKFTEADVFRPLPYVRFEASDIREALNYMQKAKHIGKIICAMPHPDPHTGSWVSKCFNERSTYLITGGLGGIGFEVCKWMVKKGAKFVVLTGRNPPNEITAKEIRLLNDAGAEVLFLKCDVGDFKDCSELLARIKDLGLPTLRGIMHAAGVLSDGSFQNQTWEKFEQTFQPKVNGSLNLHELTLKYPLEHFVFFSSAVACLGSLGQSNHCAANTFIDNLVFHRHSLGLPATTINWGQWGQVGVAANKEVVGVKPMTTLQCISAMDLCLRQNRIQTAVCEIDVNLVRQYFRTVKTYSEELSLNDKRNEKSLTFDSVKFWKDYDDAASVEEKTGTVKTFLKLVIKQVVRLAETDCIADEAKFQEIGMDSLMMIEMKNQIQATLGDRVQISNSAVKDCTNVNELSKKLVEIISGKEAEAFKLQLPREELIQLLRTDSNLPEEIKIIPGTIPACLPSKIGTVFVTGASGNFGPFILKELCRREAVKKIICLMRPQSKLSGKQRLVNTVKEKGLEGEVNMDIVEIVEGDVVQGFLGMLPETYEYLADIVDAIIHLSVKADIQDFYCKAEEGKANARSVNVIGTNNVLRFAVHKKVKHVYHASTLLTANAADKDNFIREDWHELNEFDEMPNNAYVMSKFVSDILVAEGVKRGIPAKVFRLPLLSGESINRAMTDLVGNHVVFRVIAFMRLGVMPPSPLVFSVLPIGQSAEISSEIFFNDSCGYEMYNIANPFACDDSEIPNMAKEFGYTVQVINLEEFLKNIEERDDAAEVLDVVKKTMSTDVFQEIEINPPVLFDCWAKNKKVLWSKKMEKFVPNYPACFETSRELLMHDLRCAKNTGIFERIGLK